jgi:hypothetical protein
MSGKDIIMKENEAIRTTFAQDTKMTPGIIRILAKIVNGKRSTYKERKEASQIYYKTPPKATTEQQEKSK